eukprot:366471-Chlamydomonas_euryale.AAC.11
MSASCHTCQVYLRPPRHANKLSYLPGLPAPASPCLQAVIPARSACARVAVPTSCHTCQVCLRPPRRADKLSYLPGLPAPASPWLRAVTPARFACARLAVPTSCRTFQARLRRPRRACKLSYLPGLPAPASPCRQAVVPSRLPCAGLAVPASCHTCQVCLRRPRRADKLSYLPGLPAPASPCLQAVKPARFDCAGLAVPTSCHTFQACLRRPRRACKLQAVIPARSACARLAARSQGRPKCSHGVQPPTHCPAKTPPPTLLPQCLAGPLGHTPPRTGTSSLGRPSQVVQRSRTLDRRSDFLWDEFFAFDVSNPAFAVLKVSVLDHKHCWRADVVGKVRRQAGSSRRSVCVGGGLCHAFYGMPAWLVSACLHRCLRDVLTALLLGV